MAEPIIIPCADEASWHAERTKAIGASEAAALVYELLGDDVPGWLPTPMQLWSKKKLALPATQQETEAMEAGKYAELAAAPWYAKRTGRAVITPQQFYRNKIGGGLVRECDHAYAIIVRHPTLPLQCTPDRIVFQPRAPLAVEGQQLDSLWETPGPLQLKNADRWLLDKWEDEEGEVRAPLVYQVQVAVEMLCTGMRWGALAAVIGGNRLRYCDIERNEGFEKLIAERATAFWESLKGDVSPAAVAGDLEPLKRQYPTSMPGLSKELEAPEHLLEMARHRAFSNYHKEQADAYEAIILAEVGPAEELSIGGRKVASCKTQEYDTAPQPSRHVKKRPLLLTKAIQTQAKATLPSHEQPILPA